MIELECNIVSHMPHPTCTSIKFRIPIPTLTHEMVINMKNNIIYVKVLCKSKVLCKIIFMYSHEHTLEVFS